MQGSGTYVVVVFFRSEIATDSAGAAVLKVETAKLNLIDYFSGAIHVNGAGHVDKNDAMAIMDHLAGTAPLDEDALKRADVNGDGEVSYLDAMSIMDNLAK